MIRSQFRAADGAMSSDLDDDAIRRVITAGTGLLWLDLTAHPTAESRHMLLDIFGFHPLAVDDALEERHVPKVDDWDRYLYVGLHEAELRTEADVPVSTHEIDIFVGTNYVITHQYSTSATVERLWGTCQRDERLMQRGATHLLYRLADELADGYMSVVDGLDEAVDLIADTVLEGSQRDVLATILKYKRALLQLRRVVAPQREVANKLARGDDQVLEADRSIYFRDVYDHYVRLADIAENLRDLVSSALDTHLSVVNNRMNEIMKTLTVITVLLAPLSFMTGFFGMNFFQASGKLDPWTSPWMFVVVAAAMLLLPTSMVFWLRRRDWM